MLKKWAAVTLSVSLALSLAACGGQQGASSAAQVPRQGIPRHPPAVRFPRMRAMSSRLAYFYDDRRQSAEGERMNQGVQMAVDEYNAAGGINGKQIELTIVDDQTLQDMAVTCANKLIGEGVGVSWDPTEAPMPWQWRQW